MSVRIRRGSRLLCPECKAVKELAFQNEKDEVILECRHKRTPLLLDPKPGHISLEHVLASPSDPLVRRLFPVADANGFKPQGRDITDILSDIGMAA